MWGARLHEGEEKVGRDSHHMTIIPACDRDVKARAVRRSPERPTAAGLIAAGACL